MLAPEYHFEYFLCFLYFIHFCLLPLHTSRVHKRVYHHLIIISALASCNLFFWPNGFLHRVHCTLHVKWSLYFCGTVCCMYSFLERCSLCFFSTLRTSSASSYFVPIVYPGSFRAFSIAEQVVLILETKGTNYSLSSPFAFVNVIVTTKNCEVSKFPPPLYNEQFYSPCSGGNSYSLRPLSCVAMTGNWGSPSRCGPRHERSVVSSIWISGSISISAHLAQ